MSGGNQRRALVLYHSEEMKILNIKFLRVGLETITVAFTVVKFTHIYILINFFLQISLR